MSSTGESPFRSVRIRDRRGLRNAQRTAVVVAAVLLVAMVASAVTSWVVTASRLEGVSVLGLDREPDGELRNVLVALADAPEGAVDGVFVVQTGPPRVAPAVLVLPVSLEVDVADRGVLSLAEVAEAGGMALLVQEVTEYSALDIHHYVRIDRTALAGAIDRNGGITDCPTPDALACPNVLGSDVLAALEAPTGETSGPARVEALADAAVLVAGEVADAGSWLDPRATLRWASEWATVLRTDLDPSPLEFRRLARELAAVDPGTLRVRVLPGLVDGGRLTVTPEEAAVLLDAFATGGPLPADVGLEAPRELVPEDVTIQVLNGVGRPGVAGDMAEFLVDRGFLVVEVGNANRFSDRAPTRIGYGDEEDLVLAELVAGFLPGADVEQLLTPPPDGVDIVVTVGVSGTD